MNKEEIKKTAKEILELSAELSGSPGPVTKQDAIAAIQAAILVDVSNSVMLTRPD